MPFAQRHECACVLRVQSGADRGDLFGLKRKILRGERINEVGQSEVDSDAGKPRKLERLNGYGHDLDGGGDAVGADQFSAHLRHLPVRTKLIRAQLDRKSTRTSVV